MPLDATQITTTFTTLTLQDYTPVTPLTVTVTELVPGSITPLVRDNVESGEIFINSATGKSRYGTPVMGLAGGQTGSFQIWKIDPSDAAEITAATPYLRALSGNSLAATAFACYHIPLVSPSDRQAALLRLLECTQHIGCDTRFPLSSVDRLICRFYRYA